MNYKIEEILGGDSGAVPGARAITLHQPWASLVAAGAKKIETRGWNARLGGSDYRGVVLIHAAQTKYDAYFAGEKGQELLGHVKNALVGAPKQLCESWPPDDYPVLPQGKILAVARIAHCVQHSGYIRHVSEQGMQETFEEMARSGFHRSAGIQITEQEHRFGDYSPERWAWYLTDVVPLAIPLTASGMQKLWTPQELVLREVYRQLSGTPVPSNESAVDPLLIGPDCRSELSLSLETVADQPAVEASDRLRGALQRLLGNVEQINATFREEMPAECAEFGDSEAVPGDPISVSIRFGGTSRG